MKIAIAIHRVLRNDGQGRVAYEIARGALERGDDVTLIASAVGEDLKERGVRWVPIRLSVPGPDLIHARELPFRIDSAFDRLARQGERFDATIAFGYTLTRPHQINVAQFVHDAWWRSPAHTYRVRRDFYGLYQGAYTLANRCWERRSFQQAGVIVAPSRLVKQELISLGISPERIRIILNAVDPEEFRPAAASRADLGLPEGVPLALFVGDLQTPRKNLDTVLRALQIVSHAHLAVIGALDGSPYPDMAERLGVAARVHFLGFRRDIASLMRAVDLFVFPSRYEPFGIVVLEAMATGLPVVISRTVGAAEVVTPDCGVVLPETDDADSLARAMCRLIDEPLRCREMGRAARAVAEEHNWTAMAEQYLHLCTEMAQ